jgi:hypothetical protein
MMPAKRAMMRIITFSYLITKIINNLTKNYQILHGYLFYQQLKQLNPTTFRLSTPQAEKEIIQF